MTKAYSYIRFSTKEQEKGDSLRRQIESSEKYVSEKGLTLDTSLNMFDSGLSAYKGKHISQGALGVFLNLVEAGQVESGSVLLIENIDRLSRLKPMDALRCFDKIIKAGIKIVTLQSGMEFTETSLNENQGQLYVIVGEIQRANQESERKSFLVSKAWENKRKQATSNERKMTAKSPAWLKLSDDKRRFDKIPEVCYAIETIFKLKASGKGTASIEKILNQMPGVWKPRSKEIRKSKNEFTIGGWRKPTINKYLTDKAVIGEYQPHKMIGGKREPIGEPIADYYPPIIDKDLFYQVQNILRSNHKLGGNAGGKTGKATNLFAHVVKCGLCGSSMHFVDKGKGPKGGTYLICSKARINIEGQEKCSAIPVRYLEFRNLFFEYFSEFDIENLIPTNNETDLRIKEIEKILKSTQYQIEETTLRIERLISTSSETPSPKTRMAYDKAIAVMISSKESLEQRHKEFEIEKAQLINQKWDLKRCIDNTKTVLSLFDSVNDEKELLEIRLKIRLEISRLFEWIKIYPLRSDEEILADLKSKKQRAEKELSVRRENGSSTMGIKIHLNALATEIKHMTEYKTHSELKSTYKSKYIDMIRFKLNGVKNHGIVYLRT